MSIWADTVGQSAAVQELEAAASPAGADELSHAWLITGPPGSGRSNLALSFAAALVSRDEDGRAGALAHVRAGTHPDVTVLTTQKVTIGIADVRDIVATAYFAPSEGRHRVIVLEDADRMPERTSNVLLKALEEPPERTVWVLCAPSEADLLPTIRSRARSLRLVTPKPEEVADLLASRDGIERDAAERAARLTLGHIGMARRLASAAEAMARRSRTIDLVLGVTTLSGAMRAAAELLEIAEADAQALTEERNEQEREAALRDLGITPGSPVPPQLRAQIRALEDDQKRRAIRRLRDGVDRILVDLLTLYRDALLIALDAGIDLTNIEHAAQIAEFARSRGTAGALAAVSAVEAARERLNRGVTPGLVIEAMLGSQLAEEMVNS